MIIKQRNGFIVLKPKKLNLETFKSNSKTVDGLYASVVAEQIFHSLISDSLNIKKDFEEYFSDEYENFNVFLKKGYDIDEDCILEINKKIDSHDILFQKERSYGGYDNYIEMLFSEELFEEIKKLTEV